jgi:iron(III) transport system permease protein
MVSAAVIAIVAVLIAYPFLRIITGIFFVRGSLTLAPVHDAVTTGGLGGLLLNSACIVACSGALAVIVGSVLAWLNERTNARIPFLTDIFPLLPLILPSVATAIGWTLLLSPGAGILNGYLRDILGWFGVHIDRGPLNIFTMYGLIFCYFLVLVPYVFLFVSAGLRNMPSEIEEQARVAGAGVLRTLRKVTLPAVKPSIAASALIVIWLGFSMFSIPIIIGTSANINVLTVQIVQLINFTYPPQTSTAVGLSLFILIVVGAAWLIQVRVMRQGLFAQVGGRGARVAQIDLGWKKWIARAGMVLFLLVSGVLPVLALLVTALQDYWRSSIVWSAMNFSAFGAVLQDPTNILALRNSLLLGLIAGTGIILFSALMSVYMLRGGGWPVRILEMAIRLPVVVSGFVLVVGIILAYSGAPLFLQGTFLLFVIAYMASSIPQSSIVADAAAAQVSGDMTEAAALAGARQGKTFFRIQLPLMAPGLIAGWTLVFVHITGDMEVAAMLSSSQQPVVGFQILNAYDLGQFGELSALSLILTVLSIVCVLIGAVGGRMLAGRSRPAKPLRTVKEVPAS